MVPVVSDSDFFRGAEVDIAIPENPSLDEYEQEISYSSSTDERPKVLVILSLPHASTDSLQSRLSRLDVKLDVWIVNQIEDSHDQPQDGQGELTSSRDLVFSQLLQQDQDPIVVVRRADGEDDDSGDDISFSTLVLWETSITLGRPRFRFSNPVAMITTSTVVNADKSSERDSNDAYLPSFVPLPANLLQPLRVLPGLQNSPPYLASSRLDRVVPKTSFAPRSITRIPQAEVQGIKILPALIARLRPSHPSLGLAIAPTIVSLEIEVVPFIKIQAVLERLDVSLEQGDVESMMPTPFPMSLRSDDSFVFLYKLQPSTAHQASSGARDHRVQKEMVNVGLISVSLQMKVLLSPTCTPTIYMSWTTNVDIGSVGASQREPIRHMTPASRPDSSTTNPGQDTSVMFDESVKLTFSTPADAGQPGTPITWKVHVDNQRLHPIKLSLVPLPRLQRLLPQSGPTRHHAPQSSSASFPLRERRHTSTTKDHQTEFARAVMDENVLYAMHHQSQPRASDTDLLSLTPEVRIGPLRPGACHDAEMKLVALRKGVLGIDCVRVLDLTGAGTGDGADPAATTVKNKVMDVTDLPVVRIE